MKRLLLTLGAAVILIGSLCAQLKIAWLSDAHIGFPTGAEDLRSVVRDINAQQGAVRAVVLSGDITEKGKNEELQLAKQILDSLALPYLIVPGNHDTKWSESGTMMFRRLFGDDKVVKDIGGYRFIGMNSGIPMRGGGGHFAPQDLRWLDSVLAVTPMSHKLIFFCHHQPDGSEIDNSHALLDRLKTCDIRFVGVGHGHTNRKYDFDGIQGIMFRSTLRRNSVPAYNIVELREDSIFVSQKNVGEEVQSPWIRFSNRSKSFQPEVEKPDSSRRSSNVEVVWEFNAGTTIGTQAVTDGRDVIIADASGTVTSLRLSNAQVNWRTTISDGTIFSSPLMTNDKAIVGSSDGVMRALRLRDGEIAWSFPTEGSVLSSPILHEGKIYVGASDGRFRALDEHTGTLLWDQQGLDENVETKPLSYDGKIIFGSWNGYLYALNESSGMALWKWSTDKPNFYYAPAACWPVAANGKVFVVAPDKYATSIHALTGQTIWRTDRFPVRESIGISNDGSKLFLRGLNDTLYCLSTITEYPDLLWKVNAGYGFDTNPSMPIEKEGVLYFGSKKGLVTAVDVQTHAIRWQYQTGNARTNTVTPVGKSEVIVTTMDGLVMLLREKRTDE